MSEHEYGVRATFVDNGRVCDEWETGDNLKEALIGVADARAEEDISIEMGDIDERTRCTFSVIRRTKPVAAGPWEPYDPA